MYTYTWTFGENSVSKIPGVQVEHFSLFTLCYATVVVVVAVLEVFGGYLLLVLFATTVRPKNRRRTRLIHARASFPPPSRPSSTSSSSRRYGVRVLAESLVSPIKRAAITWSSFSRHRPTVAVIVLRYGFQRTTRIFPQSFPVQQ